MIPIPARIVHGDDWHEKRRGGTGGSEWPDILSMNYPDIYKYNCLRRFWYQKTGMEVDFWREITPEQARGLILEPIVRELYETRMKEEEVDFRFITGPLVMAEEILPGHPRPDWWIGNLDDAALVNGIPRVAEWKTMNGHMFRIYRNEGLPSGYRLQPQHYMALLTYEGLPFDMADLVVYSPDCSGFEIEPIPKDEETLELMLNAGDYVWGKVIPAEDPPDFPPLTPERCGNCQYRVSCLGPEYYQTHVIKLADLTNDEDLYRLLTDYNAARSTESDAKKEKDRLKYLITKHIRMHHADPEHFFCKEFEVKYEKGSDEEQSPKRPLYVRTPQWRMEMHA